MLRAWLLFLLEPVLHTGNPSYWHTDAGEMAAAGCPRRAEHRQVKALGLRAYSSLFERWLVTQRGNILWWDGPKCQNAKSCPSSPFSEKAIWAPGGHWRLTNTAQWGTNQSGKAWIKGTPKSFAVCTRGSRTFLSWGEGEGEKEELNGRAYGPEVNC